MKDIGTRVGAQPSLYPLTSDQSRMWMPCRNIGNENIPPYSIVQLAGVDSSYYAQDAEENQVCWLVKKPDEEGCNSGNPARFAFTGPLTIFSGKPGASCGRVTWSFPVQVRHIVDPMDNLPNGFACGPHPGTWGVTSRYRGYVCLSHDAAFAVNEPGVHTVFVMPLDAPMQSFGRWVQSASTSPTLALSSVHYDEMTLYENVTSAAGDTIQWNSGDMAADWFDVYGGQAYGVRFTHSGVYDFNLSATIWSADSNDPGRRLGLSVIVYRARRNYEYHSLLYEAVRYHDVERDQQYGLKVNQPENVAVGGYVPVHAGDILVVKNTSSVALSIEALSLTLSRRTGLLPLAGAGEAELA